MLNDTPETIEPSKKQPSLRRFIFVFFLGALCFLVTQVFTRVPLLNWLQGEPGFLVWAMSYPVFSGVMIAFTAGIFEESGRFAFKALAINPAKSRISEPVVFKSAHFFH